MKGIRCDICEMKDGHQNLTMIRCDTCELVVHRECNCMQSYTKKTFTCWACKAVGKSFEIEERDKQGNRRKITQEQRPTKCVLCNVSDGIHAMHPLYDGGGPGGRQIYHDGSLAWVHTLCVQALTSEGLLYGCSRDGHFDGDDDYSDGGRSENSELMDEAQESVEEYGTVYAPVHHFVYETSKYNKAAQRKYYDTKKLRCSICGEDDKSENILRLCVQCNANDGKEWKDFKEKGHPSLGSKETCTAAYHVGCARWGGLNHFGVRRVYFFPGDEETAVVTNTFCSLHAEDVDYSHQKKLKLAEERRRAERREDYEKRRLEELRNAPPPKPAHQIMFEDMARFVAPIQCEETRQKAFQKRKDHWKATLNLPPKQFSDAWKIAKKNLRDYIANGKSLPIQRSPAREGSTQRVVAQSQAPASARRESRILEAQRLIANQRKGTQQGNSPSKRGKSLKNLASISAKRRRQESDPTADSDGEEGESEWREAEGEGLVESNNEEPVTFSLVSGLCRPLPQGCLCCKDEMLVPELFQSLPRRKDPIDVGKWDLDDSLSDLQSNNI